ncbi:hypothetical protein XENOCAPTIV_004739 [Xenoophorus captivus]|uniref:CYRIA/CYRIB Rac1 binding domain-containing protein n=1 Tax=Xenoophorus captivus TaxID=1517983 RepID=A0ABV0S7G8_9TELE
MTQFQVAQGSGRAGSYQAVCAPRRSGLAEQPELCRSELQAAERWQQRTRGRLAVMMHIIGLGEESLDQHSREQREPVTSPGKMGGVKMRLFLLTFIYIIGELFIKLSMIADDLMVFSRAVISFITGEGVNMNKMMGDFVLVTSLVLSFADAQPTEAERDVWEEVDVVLKDAKGILDELQSYKGAGQEIREVQMLV